jgi:hypothetical protein
MARIEINTDAASPEELDAIILFISTIRTMCGTPSVPTEEFRTHVAVPSTSDALAEQIASTHLHLTDGEAPIEPVTPAATGYEHIFGQNAPALVTRVPPVPNIDIVGGEIVPSFSSPPVQATPAVPSTAVVATFTNAPGVTSGSSVLPNNELDIKGRPWDERIHSSSKMKIVDGTWKYKRGVAKAEIEAIEQGLQPSIVAAPVIPTPPSAVPLPPAQASGLPPPPPPASAKAMSFVEFMKWAMGLLQSKRITHDQINAACKQAGIAAMTLLNQQPAKIPVVVEAINAQLLNAQ